MDTFQGKKSIIKSLIPLIENLNFVVINKEKLNSFCDSLHGRHFPFPDWSSPIIYPNLDETGVDYFILMNSLNFCYWGNPRWTVEYKNRKLDGAWGMFAALSRALEEGFPIWDGEFLASLSRTDFATIFRGNVKIPLFEQRLAICREIGRGLSKQFGGRFYLLVKQAEKSAVKLCELLFTTFPSFDDTSSWEGHHLLFYKRAQLAPAMLQERWKGLGPGQFRDIELLTVSADYKLPQILRRFGIIEYTNGLDRIVDEGRHLPARSREELEIRSATIMATEMMLSRLQPRIKGLNSQRLDRLLWLLGQKKSPEDKPYHKTLTINY